MQAKYLTIVHKPRTDTRNQQPRTGLLGETDSPSSGTVLAAHHDARKRHKARRATKADGHVRLIQKHLTTAAGYPCRFHIVPCARPKLRCIGPLQSATAKPLVITQDVKRLPMYALMPNTKAAETSDNGPQ